MGEKLCPNCIARINSKPICGSCRFWDNSNFDPSYHEEMGRCRKSAPQLVLDKGKFVSDRRKVTAWPCVYFDEWCGDHEPEADTCSS